MGNNNASVLLLDDDPIVLDSLKEFLLLEGYDVTATRSLDEALAAIDSRRFEAVLSDIRLPKGSGFDLLEKVRQKGVNTAVIMFTGYGTIEDAVRAIKMGAFDYVTKPLSDDEVRLSLERALRQQRLVAENRRLREELNMSFRLDNFICRDKSMRRVIETIKMVADSNTTVLLTGESGTGKTLAARCIHHNSPRRNKAFVEVSCGALPDTLLESELFGHKKGSFSGAISNKAGKFELADGGTIFLDEISNASASLQMKLLRVLESFEFEPVGDNRTRKVDTRVILATNRDLWELVEGSEFREDLYYRVNVVNIFVAPLRERPEDIPLLARHFLDKYAGESVHPIKGFSEEVMRALTDHNWPGNVRELENVVQRAVVMCRSEHITVDDLPPALRPAKLDEPAESGDILPLEEAMARWERKIIIDTLHATGGSRKEAAECLGINRTTLYNKMKRYGIME